MIAENAVTVAELAEARGVAKRSVRFAIRAGRIRADVQDGRYLIPAAEAEKYWPRKYRGLGRPGGRVADEVARVREERAAEAEKRFWAKVDRSAGPDGCWPWTGYVDDRPESGHRTGARKLKGKNTTAKMAAWRRAFGPVPNGKSVNQTCGNPLCCNPAHMKIGFRHGHERNGLTKVLDGEIPEMFAMRRAGMTLKAIGARFGVHLSHVCHILRGKHRRKKTDALGLKPFESMAVSGST